MATRAPAITIGSPLIEALRARFERLVYAEGAAFAPEAQLARIYSRWFAKPYVCSLMADVLSGRWGLGDTQASVSSELGVENDRTWVSRARRHGVMPLEVFVRLRCWPTRPPDWEPDIQALRRDMERSAFIGIAREFAGRIPNRPTLCPVQLNELNYELICEVFGSLDSWSAAYANRDTHAAQRLVQRVEADVRRNVDPLWCTDRARRRIRRELRRMAQEPAAAYAHLAALQRDWLDVFVGTSVVVEDMSDLTGASE